MIHPDTRLEVISEEIGLGVRASRPIPRGTLLWVRDALDLVLTPEAVEALAPNLQAQVGRLGYQDSEGRIIVCWDGGKHINHSCHPTMRGIGPDAMIAIVDVEPGDEITCDYAECNLEEALSCLCGAASCRGRIGGSMDPALWRAWQHEAAMAARAAGGLHQPLLDACVDRRLPDILAGRAPVPDLSAVEKKR